MHNDRKLSMLDPAGFQAIYDQEELAETFRMNLKMEFATTETEVHQADLAAGAVPMAQELLRSITNKVLQRAKLPTAFAKLYPLVRTYVATRCFGKMVDLDSEAIRVSPPAPGAARQHCQIPGTRNRRADGRKTGYRV